jgi:thioesterase domain-containing protein/acyl carrier protein
VTALISERVRGDPGDAASSTLRARIAFCFAQTLAVSELDDDADFFDLGGDSVAALDLALRLQDATGIPLPMTAVFDAPSIAAMMAVIGAGPRRAEGAPIVLKPGAGRCPVFLFPGACGAAVGLRGLARALDTDQAVLGFDTPGFGGRSNFLARVEDLADAHVPHLRAAAPGGGCVLAGYSVGGLVAYELARRLAEEGAAPRLVVLIDSVISRAHYRLPDLLRIWRRRAGAHWQSVRQGSPATALRVGASHIPHVWRDIVPRRSKLAAHPVNVSDAGAIANRTYRPRRYDGPVALLWSQHGAEQNALDLVWHGRAPRLSVYPIPGAHLSAITAHLPTTAAAFSRALSAGL